MPSYRHILWGVALSCASLPHTAEATSNPDPELNKLIELVLASHPKIASIEARIEGLKQAESGASAWTDPMFAVEYSNMPIGSPAPGNHPMSGIQFKLQQTFPWPGKTSARERAASADVSVEQEALAETQTQIAHWIARNYYELVLVRELRALNKEHLQLIEQFAEIARSRYVVGRGSQSDVLQLEVHGQRLQEELFDLESRETQLILAINTAIGRANNEPITTSPLSPKPSVAPNLSEIESDMSESRPMLRQYRKISEAQTLRAESYEKEGRPDITAWIGYRLRLAAGVDQGEDFLTAGLSIPLPWFWNGRRWDTKAEQHRANSRSALAQRDAALDRLQGELGAAVTKWQRAFEKTNSYRGKLIPSARKTLDATLSSYQVGKIEFASLLQTELQLLELERDARIAQTDALKACADVKAILGVLPERTVP